MQINCLTILFFLIYSFSAQGNTDHYCNNVLLTDGLNPNYFAELPGPKSRLNSLITNKGSNNVGLSFGTYNEKLVFIKWLDRSLYDVARSVWVHARESQLSEVISKANMGPKYLGRIINNNRVGLISDFIEGELYTWGLNYNQSLASKVTAKTILKLRSYREQLDALELVALDAQIIVQINGEPVLIDFGNYLSYEEYDSMVTALDASYFNLSRFQKNNVNLIHHMRSAYPRSKNHELEVLIHTLESDYLNKE